MGDGRYGWEMARRKGEVSSKARHVEARRLDNAAHRKRLIVVDAVLVDRLGDVQSRVCETAAISRAGSCPRGSRGFISGTTSNSFLNLLRSHKGDEKGIQWQTWI